VAPTAAPAPAAAARPAAPEATADATEKPPVAEPKKPARKRVAHAPKEQPRNFFDFFSGGFNNNGRANSGRSRSAQSNNGFRPFF
jgi:membrane protein involved in colicin uptake